MKVAKELNGIFDGLGRAGGAFVDGFKNFGANWKAAREAGNVAAEAARTPGLWSKVGSGIAAPFKAIGGASARAGLWVVEQPVAALLKPVKWTVNGVAGFYTKFKVAAPILTVVGAALGIGSYLAHRRSEALQENFANAQAQAMAAQNAQPAYTLAPGEFTQNVAPLMKGADNSPQTGHAADILAKRAAADKAAQEAANGQPVTSVA